MELLISPDAKGYFQKADFFQRRHDDGRNRTVAENFCRAPGSTCRGRSCEAVSVRGRGMAPFGCAGGEGLPLGTSRRETCQGFRPAYIRMKEFPHLYPDGIVLDSMGFKSKTFTTVPLMMETGTDEFSIYAAQDPYFAPYVADRSILTNEKMRKEFEFAKKYGSAMVPLVQCRMLRHRCLSGSTGRLFIHDDRLWRRSRKSSGMRQRFS